MATGLVFTAHRHAAGCGDPPAMDNTEPKNYCGYFENRYREQWLFIFDREKQRGYLRGGDTGWENVYPVVDGSPGGGLVLADEEMRWLAACWRAATGG